MLSTRTARHISGFTLIEIMVVVSIIAIMVAVVSVNFSATSESSRDAERQSDLRAIQTALEAYKNREGRYPAQCTASGGGGWSGQLGTDYQCTDGNGGQYIVGLAPEYIPVLPVDPKLNGTNSGYVYRTNTAGSVYKLMAMNSVESEIVTHAHEFSSCDVNPNDASANIQLGGWCRNVNVSGWITTSSMPPDCRQDTSTRFRSSYGVWGGFAPYNPTTVTSLNALATGTKMTAVRDTTTVICR